MAERLLTPSKITAWLDCAHFLRLRHVIDSGVREPAPNMFGEMAHVLVAKGLDHEQAVLDRYRSAGRDVFVVPDRGRHESFARWVARVGEVLGQGHDAVFQMPFVHNEIRGIADFLERVVGPDGHVTYEPVDAKLARNAAKPGHVLQLCFYAEAIAAQTGHMPEHVHIELGSGERETIRVHDVLAYWRRLRGQLATRRGAADRDHQSRTLRSLQLLRVRVGVRRPVASSRFAGPRRRCPSSGPRASGGRRGRHDRQQSRGCSITRWPRSISTDW